MTDLERIAQDMCSYCLQETDDNPSVFAVALVADYDGALHLVSTADREMTVMMLSAALGSSRVIHLNGGNE